MPEIINESDTVFICIVSLLNNFIQALDVHPCMKFSSILYSSGKNLIEITQILSIYVAASFRILPSITRIVNNLQNIKLNSPAINVLYSELKNFKKDDQLSYEKFSFYKNIYVDI